MISTGSRTARTPVMVLLAVVMALGLQGPSALLANGTIFVSPDVPTNPDGTFFLPWEILRHDLALYNLEFTVPGNPAVNAIHKLDLIDSWIFSIETPSDLAGQLSADAEGRDVVHSDGATYSLYFCGGALNSLTDNVPATSNIDALFLEGGDSGDLIVSFDVPTTIQTTTFQPTALVRFARTGFTCADWQFVGLEFDLAATLTASAAQSNLIGAARIASETLLAFDTPTDLAPSAGPATYLPGQIASWNGAQFDLFADLGSSGTPGWSIRSRVDALACQANPGRIDPTVQQILMNKNLPSVSIDCPASCSSGAEQYAVYEGSLSSFAAASYDHVQIGCTETCPGTIIVSPPATDTYYLVVPHNDKTEGSHGLDSNGNERPQAALAGRCVATQVLTTCP